MMKELKMHIANQKNKILSKTEILIGVSEGRAYDGYDIVEHGLDEGQSYTDIKAPDGEIERIRCVGNILREIATTDSYNSIHNHRRDGDKIRLYYDAQSHEVFIVAVMHGDDLSGSPFVFQNGFTVTERMINHPKASAVRGLLAITARNLFRLEQLGILTKEMVNIIKRTRKNVGFHF